MKYCQMEHSFVLSSKLHCYERKWPDGNIKAACWTVVHCGQGWLEWGSAGGKLWLWISNGFMFDVWALAVFSFLYQIPLSKRKKRKNFIFFNVSIIKHCNSVDVGKMPVTGCSQISERKLPHLANCVNQLACWLFSLKESKYKPLDLVKHHVINILWLQAGWWWCAARWVFHAWVIIIDHHTRLCSVQSSANIVC